MFNKTSKLYLIKDLLINDVNTLCLNFICILLYTNNNSPIFIIPIILSLFLFIKRLFYYFKNLKVFNFFFIFLLFSYIFFLPFILILINNTFNEQPFMNGIFFKKCDNSYNSLLEYQIVNKNLKIKSFFFNSYFFNKYTLI